jgi:uncharacterized protein
MKIFFTLFSLLAFYLNINAQSVPNYFQYKSMTPQELYNYRQTLWDTLPAAIGWVNDFGDLFTEEQEQQLEKTLAHFEKNTSIEIAIVTLDSNMIAANKFNDYSYRLMKIWGIGKISKSNGMLICICKDYKKICVTTDFGIEQYLSTYEKNRLINKDFIPYFAKNDYYDGTSTGLNAMLSKISKRWNKIN